ncbi:hypothetical protein [Rubrivirga sp.]|uniref:hypothetical protein n=1 Tax=Rubrivirga sp. TaxID=1885344 RepID=UPI003B517727
MRALLLASALAVSACAGPDPVPTGPDAPVSVRALAGLTDSLAAARSTTPRRAFLRRQLVRAGVTPFGDGGLVARYQTDLGVPVVGGFVPGRSPLGRSELVVLGTRADGPATAAVLEAARVLVERSLWTSQPERTVEVAFWSAGDGVRQVIRSSLWPRAAVRAVVMAGPEGPAEIDGVAIERLDPALDPVALAQALVDRTTARARYVPPADPDLGGPADSLIVQ